MWRPRGLWLDKWHLIPGDPWEPAIEKALAESETCAVFVGPSGFSNPIKTRRPSGRRPAMLSASATEVKRQDGINLVEAVDMPHQCPSHDSIFLGWAQSGAFRRSFWHVFAKDNPRERTRSDFACTH
jgi:hypothetical protein